MSVALVGAGPGDPDLITRRGLRLIQECDVLIYDRLVGAELVAEAPDHALLVDRDGIEQEEVNELLVRYGLTGLRVVRLKGGDPALFARAGEELDFLRRHGFDPAIVPGVTAALGCAAALGMPLTDRRAASGVTIVAGHARDGEPAPDWRRLAGSRRTLVVYMGRDAAREIAEGLVLGGQDARTPVAVVVNGTRDDQRVETGVLADLPALVARLGTTDPTLLVIGEVVRLSPGWAPVEPAWTAAW